MELTPRFEMLDDGSWKVTVEELPGVYYVGSQQEVHDRIGRLIHALRSPNIRIERVLPNGDVVLTLTHNNDGETFAPLRPRQDWSLVAMLG